MRREQLFLGSDADTGQDLVLDPRELTTHAFCVGMTGSGKTGLCSVLIEELLDKGIPVIAVDPKGDLGNLLLPVDPADPSSFAKWAAPGTDVAAAAAALGAGLAQSGLNREDLLRYRSGHQARIVTPGATFGAPVDVLGALAPPKDPAEAADATDTVVRSILGLLQIDADPVRSREYLLLHALVSRSFSAGQPVTLPELVRQVSDPPFAEVGALPLDVFFPRKERTSLMLALNGLLASPSFAAWRQGEALDLDRWFKAAPPTLTVYSIAHLGDEERVFALSLLLERTLAWMRRQPGTGGLRAVLYIDEIYGFFPPHPADPPTKRPLLTLLKQARAFGLGVVLATQNPVDLDYKGLANTGTWFVGRLQTEQDRARLRDGLLSAATVAGQAAPDIQAMLAKLEKRVFLLHSVHRPKPTLLRSRQAYSFLRGPLSREEITELSARSGTSANASGQSNAPAAQANAAGTPPNASGTQSIARGASGAPGSEPVLADATLGPLYCDGENTGAAHLFVKFAVRFRVARELTPEETFTVAFPLAPAGSVEEALEAEAFPVDESSLSESRPQSFGVTGVPTWLGRVNAAQLNKVVKARLPTKLKTRLFVHTDSKLVSKPGESKEEFVVRATGLAASFPKTNELLAKLEKKRRDLTLAQEQLSGRKAEKWASVGTTVLGNVGLIFGKKRTISGVGGVLSKNRMEDAAEGRVEALAAEVKGLFLELQDLKSVDEDELQEEEVAAQAKDVAIFRVAIAYL